MAGARFITLFVILSSACKVNSQSSLLEQFVSADTTNRAARFAYLKKVSPTDTICLNDIKRAIRDSSGDSALFVFNVDGFSTMLRYENELAQICKSNQLKFKLDIGTDIGYVDQTTGCYQDYLDLILFEKYGKNFKPDLHKEANDLYLANHLLDTISSWDCDIRPRCLSANTHTSISIVVDLPIKAHRKEWVVDKKPMFAVYHPFMDLSVVIDKDGNTSGYQLVDFIPARRQNKKYKEQLLAIAIQEIKNKYYKWKPAEINGVLLNTTHVMRLEFEAAAISK
ncbi:MAG: hypothetical protein HOP30_02745 [Cyclobacteriaceae bacterium]|nr:hypothetical protein [Cyclobacteriaceae bacterium]